MGTSLTLTGMIIVTLAQAANLVIRKAALSNGMNKYVYVVYGPALSDIIFLSLSLIYDRPPLTVSILFRIFLLSLIGVFLRIFAAAGLEYSTPIVATALLNLVPAFTFVLAIIFRMEKVNWRSRGSVTKSLGTIVSVAGAFVITFYKGIPILKSKTSLTIVSPLQQLLSPIGNWILGSFFLAAEALLDSGWYILQTSIVRRFPAVFTIMFYYYVVGIIMSSPYSLFVVDDAEAWKLRLDVGLVAILFSAIVSCGVEDSINGWCLFKAGPIYVTMFKPLGIIFSVILDFLFLGDSLGLGSLIGATIIVIGFYSVLWGKAKEENGSDDAESDLGSSISSDNNAPLLQTRIEALNIL